MDPQTHLIPFNALKGTYFDTLPEELLIEICILIKEDSILYELSEWTRSAYLKYLDSLFKGYINNFMIYKKVPSTAIEIIRANKDELVSKSGFSDIKHINKLYYYFKHFNNNQYVYEIIYQSNKNNYFYVKLVLFTTHNHPVIDINRKNIKIDNNWKDFWTSLDNRVQENLLIRNNYAKWLNKDLL